MGRFSPEVKVGVFACAIIAVIFWSTIRVSDRSAVSGGGYDISLIVDSASGLKMKAPVELAGVGVGVIKSVALMDSRRAKVTVRLNSNLKIAADSRAILRTRGFLGESYVEIIPGSPDGPFLGAGDQLSDATRTGDINALVGRFNEIATDVKAITGNLKTLSGTDNAPINRIVENLDKFTRTIAEVTVRNTENIDRIASNMAELTQELRELIAEGRKDVEAAAENIASITGKINRGEGTIGKLVNDEETVNKLNESLDGLNDTLGGFRQLETELGFHTEYLTHTTDFKNYVSLSLKPTPDKALLVDLLSDPDPNPSRSRRTTDITAGGATSTVVTDTASVDRNKLRFSVQLAKQFYDFTVRGGIIESTGGMGMDYTKGPFGLRFSAFDFSTRNNQKPHLKLLGDVSLTKNLFLVGGADDMINPRQRTDYFFGAGFRFVDDDLKRFARFAGSGSSLAK